jgi:hypothetical protein
MQLGNNAGANAPAAPTACKLLGSNVNNGKCATGSITFASAFSTVTPNVVVTLNGAGAAALGWNCDVSSVSLTSFSYECVTTDTAVTAAPTLFFWASDGQ